MPMTSAGIRRLAASENAEIGAHGYFHTSLGLIPHREAVEELGRSKSGLEELTDREVTAVAYPDGSYTRSLVDAAEDIGYPVVVKLVSHTITHKSDVGGVRLGDEVVVGI